MGDKNVAVVQHGDDAIGVVDLLRQANYEVEWYYYPAEYWSLEEFQQEVEDLRPFYDKIIVLF